MERLKQTFRQPGFQIAAFIFCFLVLGWPLLSLTGGPSVFIPIYLFIVWTFIIIGLYFVSRSVSEDNSLD